MKNLLLATAAALVISTGPAAALKIDSVTFPTNELATVILSDIPEGTESVTCAFYDGGNKYAAVVTDIDPDVVHEMLFVLKEDDDIVNIKCWLGRDHSTEVARSVWGDGPPRTDEDMARDYVPMPPE